jgi:HK97 family phage portal protein
MLTLDKLKHFLSKAIIGFDASDVVESKLGVFPEWFFTARLGQPRMINITEIRTFSKSPWIQMVLNTKKREISTIEWDVVEKDVNSLEKHDKEIQLVKDFLNNMNSEKESISDLMSMKVTDWGEIDAGASVNVFSRGSYDYVDAPVIDDLGRTIGNEKRLVLKPIGSRKLLQVRPIDAGTVLKQIDIYRRIQGYYQYSFKNPRSNPIRFEPDEINYIHLNKKSYSVYGFSPVQAIQQVIELLIQATRWNKDFYKNNAIPDAILGFPGIDQDSFKQFKNMYNKEVKGKPHKLLFTNYDPKLQVLNPNNRDMEWLEGQKWYHWLVFAVFGISPVEAGFHENVSQGNTDGQERVTVRNGIKPDLSAGEQFVNKRIIPELLQKSIPKIEFKFFPKDHVREQIEFTQAMDELDRGVITINEYRQTKGLQPVEWGDMSIVRSEGNIGNYDKNTGKKPDDKNTGNSGKSEVTGDPAKKKTLIFEKNIIESGSDIVDESEDYETFLINKMKEMEKKVISSLDQIPIEKNFDKTFGEFLKDLMNSVNVIPFINRIKIFVKNGIKAGLKSAEEELNVDIGFTQIFSDKVNLLAEQQLTGYMINGEKWHGIKGATKDLQVKILNQVQEDIVNKKSRKEMAENIQNIFEGSSFNQATRIARTESTRFINEGKLTGYKESGITGVKCYEAVMDSHTSELCRRLHNKYFENGISFDDKFNDEKTGTSVMYPPSHPNCRCSIIYRKK